MKNKTKNNAMFLSKFILLLILNCISIKVTAESLRLVTIFYPPYIYKEDEVVKGFSVDIIKKVFQKMNQKIAIDIQPWVRSQQDIHEGKADAIFTVFKNSERELFMDFSETSVVDQYISFYVKGDAKIRYDGDFKKINPNAVGVVRGVSYGAIFALARDQNVFPIEESSDYEKCILKLQADRTKVIIGSEIVVNYIIHKLNIKQNTFKKLVPRVETLPSYIAFTRKKNLSEIKKKFDSILQKMKKNGEYDKIVHKWENAVKLSP